MIGEDVISIPDDKVTGFHIFCNFPNLVIDYEYQDILEDMNYVKHLKMIHEEVKDAPHFIEGLILLKVWIQQRDFHKPVDGFTGFLMTMLILYLLKKNVLTKAMSSYQILKGTFQWIANTDISNGLTFDDDNIELLEKFKEKCEMVLLDGKLNIFNRITKQTWKELQEDANISLQHFEESNKIEAIQPILFYKQCMHEKYDMLLSYVNSHLLITKKG